MVEIKRRLASSLLKVDCYFTVFAFTKDIPKNVSEEYKKYQFSVALDSIKGKNTKGDIIYLFYYNKEKARTLARSAKQIAEIFGLEAIVSEPKPLINGKWAMYMGFTAKNYKN